MNNMLQPFKSLLYEQVDPLVVSQRLYRHGRLEKAQKKVICLLLRQSSHRGRVWDYMLPIIEKQCPFHCLLDVLLNCGYIELFINISIQWKLSKLNVDNMQRTSVMDSNRKSSQELLMQLKIKTHNIQLDNPRTFLGWKSEQYKKDYLSESDETRKIIKADNFAASLCAEIDAYTILYVRRFPSHRLFDKLKSIIPHTSNTHVTQVAYDTRLALAYSIADQEDKGEENLRRAMSYSIHIGYCVELVEMLYIYVFNLIGVYEKHPCERVFEKITNIAEYCIQCLQEETKEVIASFWKRRIYLRTMFCFLGISNRGDIIPGIIVLPKYIRKANDLMIELDKLWDGLETRRLMFYYVAKARLAELEEELEFATECLDMAVDIGNSGEFGEVKYIEGYLNSVKEMYKRTQQQEVSINNTIKPETTRTAVENTDRSVIQEETLVKYSSSTFEKHLSDLKDPKSHYNSKASEYQTEKGRVVDTKPTHKSEFFYSFLH